MHFVYQPYKKWLLRFCQIGWVALCLQACNQMHGQAMSSHRINAIDDLNKYLKKINNFISCGNNLKNNNCKINNEEFIKKIEKCTNEMNKKDKEKIEKNNDTRDNKMNYLDNNPVIHLSERIDFFLRLIQKCTKESPQKGNDLQNRLINTVARIKRKSCKIKLPILARCIDARIEKSMHFFSNYILDPWEWRPNTYTCYNNQVNFIKDDGTKLDKLTKLVNAQALDNPNLAGKYIIISTLFFFALYLLYAY